MPVPDCLSRAHICGIGGIGTSGLALLLLDLGASISGSDLRKSELTECLEKRGVRIQYDADPQWVRSASCLIIPAVFPPQHPEVLAARDAGIPVLSRTHALCELCQQCAENVVLCCGTLSRALAARTIAHSLGLGYCAGCSLGDGSPHARWDSRIVIDIDERECLANPDIIRKFAPSAIVVSDWQTDHFGYYSNDESLDNLIAIARKTGADIVYPKALHSNQLIVAYEHCAQPLPLTTDFESYAIQPDTNFFVLSHEKRDRVSVTVSGTLSDASAVAASWMFCRERTNDDFQPCALKCVGWFSSCTERHYHDIRMHPVSVYAALRALRIFAEHHRIVLAMKPFISTFRHYPLETWKHAFQDADRVVIITPPYEGCDIDDCTAFCHKLQEQGLSIACLSLSQARQEAQSAFCLWIGAPDILL